MTNSTWWKEKRAYIHSGMLDVLVTLESSAPTRKEDESQKEN